MKHQNQDRDPVKIDAELIHPDAWVDDDKPRPARVVVAPGAVVNIKDEYSVRRRAAWSKERDAESAPPAMASIVDELTNGKLKPHGADAVQMFESTFHDELPSVKRAMAELARKGAAERGEVKPGEARPRTY